MTDAVSQDQQELQQDVMQQITTSVMGLMDGWKLQTAEMQQLLDLPSTVRARAFNKFREGREAFPLEPSVIRRARYLLRISEALHTMYPCNPRMSERWMRMPHRRFGRRTPLTIILESGGEGGLIAVLSELDCTFSWDLTGSKPM